MHPIVEEKIEMFNRLFVKNASGQLSRAEAILYLELKSALRRIGKDTNYLVKVA